MSARVLLLFALVVIAPTAARADYQAEVLADNPLAYWRLGDAAAPAADASGNGFTASPAMDTVAFATPGLHLNDTDLAAAFSGNGQLLSPPFEKMAGGGFSVEFWVRFNTAPTGFTNLVGDGEAGGDFNLMVYALAGGALRAHVQTDAGVAAIDSVDPFAAGGTHHIVSTWDSASGELLLYVDGAVAATTVTAGAVPTSGAPLNTDNPIYIGQDGREPRAPDAVLDEVAIYDFPLAAARVAAHFATAEVPDPPDPPDPPSATAVPVGASSLIGTLDYSDTFTVGGGAPTAERQAYPAQTFPLPGGVEVVESAYGNPSASWPANAWSIATDSAVNPGGFGYPGGSGAGSDTGMTQRGGGGDWSIPYGLRDVFVVQTDFVQLGDRVDMTVGPVPGDIFGAGNLSVFFRRTGHPNFPEIGIFNGSLETDTGLTSGIAAEKVWQNYALLVDLPGETIEVFVNEQSRGVIDLGTIGGGAYAGIVDNTYVGVGGAGNDRLWSDNFQVGAPGAPAPLAITAVSYDPASGELSLTWNSTPGTEYVLELSLGLNAWAEAADGIVSGGDSTTHQIDLTPILPAGTRDAQFRISEFAP